MEQLQPRAQTNKGLDRIAGRGGGVLLSSDDLTDRHTRPNTSGRSFHSMKDPRARSKYAKPNEPQIDKELKDLIDSHADYHLVAYHEHTEQTSSVVSSNELKDKE